MEISKEEKAYLLKIVALVLEQCVGLGKKLEELSFPPVPNPKLAEKCGAFVTYHKGHGQRKELRGCIGYMEGIFPLWETVARMAYAAAFQDTRFLPLENAELPEISYEITVLTPFEPCASVDDIEIGKHGILMECANHWAVFLPQVPLEQGWSKIQTLEFLALKAGLSKNAWQNSDTRFFVFTGIVLEDNAF
jgi:hypothetical protein